MSTQPFALSIAGLGLVVSCDNHDLMTTLQQRYESFAQPGPEYMVAQIYLDKRDPGGEQLDTMAEFRRGVLHFDTASIRGYINEATGQAQARIGADQPVEAVDYFLRAAYSLMAFHHGGFLFHAAGILEEGQARLFFGHSGSGKTTIARLSPPESVLNDDLVILLPEGRRWVVFGTPFTHATQVPPWSSGQGVLKAMFHLRQDRRVFAEELTPGKALAYTVANVPIIPLDPTRMQALLRRAITLLRTVPAYALHFTPDPSFWSVVNALNPEGEQDFRAGDHLVSH